MSQKLGRMDRLLAIRHSPEEVEGRTLRIYRAVLSTSEHVQTPNFRALGVADLVLMFGLYDAEFFGGLLEAMLRQDGAYPMEFRLSKRMTNAGGKTFHRRTRRVVSGRAVDADEYEIAVSTFLLFQTFERVDRPVTVGGVECRDRLEALQRIVEHELLHLAEFLATGRSKCSAEPFKGLARAIFGHSASVHNLVTPREVAEAHHAIRSGDLVAFDFEGETRVGRVNRITKRATVLVESPAGRPYSDGRRYLTFYVPLDRLRKPG